VNYFTQWRIRRRAIASEKEDRSFTQIGMKRLAGWDHHQIAIRICELEVRDSSVLMADLF
jgi:hypothetical protein